MGCIFHVCVTHDDFLQCKLTGTMQGLDALGYQEHIDYDLVESTNPAFQKAIVRVNVFRDHRQVCCCTATLFLLSLMVIPECQLRCAENGHTPSEACWVVLCATALSNVPAA